jgi:hypothetical protein
MLKLIIPILILLAVIILFKKNKLGLDLTGLLIVTIAVFLLLSNNSLFLYFLSSLLSINYVPLSILAVAIGLLFILCICFSVLIHDTRKRQVELLQKLAYLEFNKKIDI